MPPPAQGGTFILLRDPPVAGDPLGEEYTTAFQDAGLSITFLPVLQTTTLPLAPLTAILTAGPSDAYSAIILTSARSVDALRSAIALAEQQLGPAWEATWKKWTAITTFAVGPRTAAAACTLGLTPAGASSGKGSILAPYITRNFPTPPPTPLLFLCGDKRRDEIPTALAQAQFPIHEALVYRTEPCSIRLAAYRDTLLASLHSSPWGVVFFSPSGVDALVSILHEADDLHLDEITMAWSRILHVAAIGPTTADAIRLHWDALRLSPLASLSTSPQPQPQSLVQSLLQSPP